jgi:hypothetical protein
MRTKKTFLSRQYPLYHYEIPENFDLDFSDIGNLMYITAKDKQTGLAVILVYRSGYPAVAAFYDVFALNAKY